MKRIENFINQGGFKISKHCDTYGFVAIISKEHDDRHSLLVQSGIGINGPYLSNLDSMESSMFVLFYAFLKKFANFYTERAFLGKDRYVR